MIIGIDMGGTHIDGVVISQGRIIKRVKNPRDRDDIFNTIWTSLKELLQGLDREKISRINLSTTVSTNAIVEDKLSKVGMIVQTGPGMNYSFSQTGDMVRRVSGYVDHRGKMVKDIDEAEIAGIRDEFIQGGMDAVGLVTKFSTRNPSHEIRMRDILDGSFENITMGHTMSGKLNFPRRVDTTYLNSAVSAVFKDFANNILKSLKEEKIDAPVYILKADAGSMDLETAMEKPVESILSGPAASFMGLNALLEAEGDGILIDIGGTTTDIFFLADGLPLFEPLGIRIGNHKTLIRAIYSESIGLGGDSYVSFEDGEIKIGPERRDQPLAFGGSYLTPTDAMVFLGLLDEGDRSKSQKGLEELGSQLSMSAEEVSNRILSIFGDMIKDRVDELLEEINSQPVYTIKELLEDKTIEADFINIIGGPAKILAPILEEKFQIETRYPEDYQLANAVGAALAKPTMEINMLADTDRKILSVPELEIYEPIDRNYSLEDAEKRAGEILMDVALDQGSSRETVDTEIVESSSFNMVKGFFGSSKNIRVKAQIKPGLIYDLRGED